MIRTRSYAARPRAAAGLCLALVLVLAGPATGQERVDSTRRDGSGTVVVPVPERGTLYYRAGSTGGVRLRIGPPGAPAGAGPVASETRLPVVPGEGPAGLVAFDRLDRLLRRMQRGDRLEIVQQPSGPVVVLLRNRPGAAAPDTVYAERMALSDEETASPGGPPATRSGQTLLPSASPDPSVAVTPAPRAALPPLAVEIERTLLETGLFESIAVQFAFDEAELLPTAHATLDALARVLHRHPALRLRIVGHTDAVGAERYNLRLSEERAAAVVRYLAGPGGLEASRFETVGFGETQPLLPNDTPTGRALNRRVGFEVVGE